MVAASFLTILLFTFTIAIAAAKPALERRSPIKVPLKRHSLVNHNVVEHDKRRVKSRNLKISGKNKNNDSNSSSESNSTSNTTTQTNFEGVLFGLNISCGDPPTFCKWLQHLVADEEDSNRFLLQTSLRLTVEGEQAPPWLLR